MYENPFGVIKSDAYVSSWVANRAVACRASIDQLINRGQERGQVDSVLVNTGDGVA